MKRVVSVLLTLILLAGVSVVPGVTSSAADIKTGTLVTFGSYPQTSVIDEDLLDELNSQTLSWTFYDYYCDGKQENYMKYADVTLSGERYRAVTFTHYRPNWWNDSNHADNTFQDENGYESGKVYWFRYDPVVWRVLDADKGLLMAENLIDSQPFHNVYYYNDNDSKYYGDQSYKHYASNWAYSSLRSWMNGDFCDTAFGAEKSYIKTVSLTTPSSYSSEHDADPTKDKVFLLSKADVLNTSYGFSSDYGSGADTNRIAYGTDYARCQGLYVYSSTGVYYNSASYWHLRTPYNSWYTDYVYNDGYVDYGIPTRNTYGGIRPALNVNLKSAMSAGVIKMTDSSGQVISGPSVISTDNIQKTNVWYQSNDNKEIKQREQEFDFSKFEKGSSEFDPDIAVMSLSIAMNAFSTDNDPSDMYIKDTMDQLGFTGDNNGFYYQQKFENNKSTDDDSAFAIGAKQLSDGKYLILVANRGVGYGVDFGGEWLSNFRVKHPLGTDRYDSYSYGFKSAADNVYKNLIEYLGNHQELSYNNIKVWITGFSRAAAISNLLAARLAEETSIGSSDIFAYTFATPYTVLKNTDAGRNYTSAKYCGIHNIIQEIDVVPRVPLASWQFGRYGTTYSLPCSKISGQNYNKLREEMVDTFKEKGYGSEYRYLYGQELALDLLLDYFDDIIYSADYFYSSGVQDLIVNGALGGQDFVRRFLGVLFGYEVGNAIIGEFKDFDSFNLMQRIGAAEAVTAVCLTHAEPASKDMVKTLLNFFGDYIKAAREAGRLFSDKDAALSRLERYDTLILMVTDMFVNLDDMYHTKLLMQHWPEVYLSWVQTALKTGNPDSIFNRGGYVHTNVKCPVDVYIYDGENNIVGKIVNDEVDESITDSVYCSVDACGEKEFYLPDNGEYTVKIIAREQGEMTVVNEYYNADRDIVSTECYLDMSLNENQEFTQTYDFADSESKITTGEEEIKPDMTAGSRDDTARAVTIGEYRNGTVTGKTNYTVGETASFAAFPDDGYKFDGWYSETGELLSSEDYYYFTITENVTIVPKFSKDGGEITFTPGDVDGDGQVIAKDARLALRFSAKLEEPDENRQKAADVDGNGQVLADDARQILRFSAKLQLEFLKK